MRTKARLLFAILVSLTIWGRAVSFEAALYAAPRWGKALTSDIPRPVSFRDTPGRGLIVRTWVNKAGPFDFALDTGAGATLVSQRVADEAHVAIKGGPTSIAGLSGSATTARNAFIVSLAIGTRDNYLPAKGEALVTNGLPRDLDGVLDPTEAFSPLGYLIDIPGGELSAFDPRDSPLKLSDQPEDGAVVPWLRERASRRPFVLLDTGERALLDTGSNLGLAIRDNHSDGRPPAYSVRDVGGGRISSKRAAPSTVAIGTMTLRRIPTDLVSGTEAGAPVLLGLTALRPFRMAFDPLHRLIQIAPANEKRRR
jgi:Aspartyl protease